MKVLKYGSVALVAAVMVGCSPPAAPADDVTPLPTPLKVDVSSDIGIGAPQAADTGAIRMVAMRTVTGKPRSDPFALKPAERQYDVDQSTQRLFSTNGDFEPSFTPAAELERPPAVVEPQPYRRLAGVVVGDSVLAIIDMGNGAVELIRPGQKIPNSEWTVVSIDQDKAVLRRGGPTLPHEITVRLESPPSGMGTGTGGTPPFGGPPAGAGGPPGGFPPGGGPPGFRGAPPGARGGG